MVSLPLLAQFIIYPRKIIFPRKSFYSDRHKSNMVLKKEKKEKERNPSASATSVHGEHDCSTSVYERKTLCSRHLLTFTLLFLISPKEELPLKNWIW